MLVDIEISFLSGRLAEATHIFQQTSLRGLYRIFFVPTDGLVHKLKMAIYFNHSQNEGDLMLIGVGTMLHDVVARCYERGRYQLYVTRFSHARKSKSQAREMDHMDYQNYAVAEDRIFNVGLAEL
jgi:hypothetical protein